MVALLRSECSKATMLQSHRTVGRGMRAVVARVTRAAVVVDDATVGEIGTGLLALLGVHRDDPDEAAAVMARKLHELRILDGERSCAETGAPLLVVSQFTLYGDTRKGRRPSWSAAAPPDRARPLVDAVVAALRARGATVATGVFGAAMAVESVNDGPFTVLLEV
jgi:D-aminoacyl-tRNA deacylase